MASRQDPKGGESSIDKKKSDFHRHFLSDLPKPKPASYDAKELVRILTKHCRTPIETRLSHSRLDQLKAHISNPRNESKLDGMMQDWFKLFDQAFFFNQLHDRVKSVSVYSKDDDSREGDWNLDNKRIRINFAITDVDMQRGQSYICVLLHEMVHAFLDLFSCRCRKVCAGKVRAHKGGNGKSGHGATWCNAMIAVQRAFQKGVFWEVDCGIQTAVELELKESPMWRPKPEQLERWGVILPGGHSHRIPPVQAYDGNWNPYGHAIYADEYSLSSYSEFEDPSGNSHAGDDENRSDEWVDDTIHSESSNGEEPHSSSDPKFDSNEYQDWEQKQRGFSPKPETDRRGQKAKQIYDSDGELRIPRSGTHTRGSKQRQDYNLEAEEFQLLRSVEQHKSGREKRRRHRHRRHTPRRAVQPALCCAIS